MTSKNKKKLEQINMKKKLNVGYFIVIILMILSGILSIISFSFFYNNMNHYVNGAQRADTAVKVCRIDVNVAARNIREMALSSDKSAYDDYEKIVEEKLAEVDTELKALEQTGVVDSELSEKYSQALQNWGEIGYAIMNDIIAGNGDSAAEKILEQCAPALQEVEDISEEIDKQTSERKAQVLKSNQYTMIGGIATIVIVIIAATLLALRIGNRIVNAVVGPVRKIEKATEELAKGNLHVELECDLDDEIGEMSNSLKSALSTLDSYVQDIRVTMQNFSNGIFKVNPQVEWLGDFEEILVSFKEFEKNMAHTVKEMQSVADQVRDGAGQIAISSSDLSEGATKQAMTIEDMAETVHTVAAFVTKNAEHAKKISGKVAGNGEAIENGNKKMQEMVEAMNAIEEASNEISQIIASINDIASQTNLLALNASIEAARAGEAGKGFAVVADQVAVLASQSAKAAKESSERIQSSVNAVAKGMLVANETAEQLEGIAQGTHAIVEEVDLVANELEEQSEQIQKISEGVTHINDVVQTNSATSQECAAASQQMSAQAESLENLIRKLRVAKHV